jgi:hypothetical protein
MGKATPKIEHISFGFFVAELSVSPGGVRC